MSDAEDWQPCPAAWSDGAKLTISNPQKSNEGWYRCVISNYAGTETSRPAKLSFGKNLAGPIWHRGRGAMPPFRELDILYNIHLLTYHWPALCYCLLVSQARPTNPSMDRFQY